MVLMQVLNDISCVNSITDNAHEPKRHCFLYFDLILLETCIPTIAKFVEESLAQPVLENGATKKIE